MHRPLEGQLYKWTNPLKGWQPRWFHVDQQQGVLHYYTVSGVKVVPVTGFSLVPRPLPENLGMRLTSKPYDLKMFCYSLACYVLAVVERVTFVG